MAERKYEKYIVDRLILAEEEKERYVEYSKRATRILLLGDDKVKGSPHIMISWYWKVMEGTPQHSHNYDEVLGFIGGDYQNSNDLGGEVELWLEDEKYVLNKSCFVYCPAGLKHCPLNVTRVDKPFIFMAISITDEYMKENIDTEAFRGK
jgi:quercetin dioxygenase-like cupin family protein